MSVQSETKGKEQMIEAAGSLHIEHFEHQESNVMAQNVRVAVCYTCITEAWVVSKIWMVLACPKIRPAAEIHEI